MSGKYDFKGIKRLGRAGLRAALATSPKTAWLLKFGSLLDLVLEFIFNWLANKGLIILNLGYIHLDSKFDQKELDKAMQKALDEIELIGKNNLTPDQKKEIDNAVIKAARKFIVIGSKPKPTKRMR